MLTEPHGKGKKEENDDGMRTNQSEIWSNNGKTLPWYAQTLRL